MTDTVKGSCHCGAVRLEFPKPREAVNECQCSICRRYGALWAYFHPDQVTITLADPATSQATYIWNERIIAFVRCVHCGCLTHWAPLPNKRDKMGVNCRVLERADLDRLPRRLSEGPP
jgi:hypothetical protein